MTLYPNAIDNNLTLPPVTPGSGIATPIGPAGGDLGGMYPNPFVTGIQNHPVPVPTGSSTMLTWNGSSFIWAGAGGFVASHDLSGTATSQTVIGIQGNPVPAPTGTNTVLTWTGSALAWNAGGGGGGGGSNVFVYRDSEPSPSGNLFATWTAAWTAAHAAALNGFVWLQVDNSLNNCTMDIGTWNMNNIILIGVNGGGPLGQVNNPTLSLPDGAHMTNFHFAQYLELDASNTTHVVSISGGIVVVVNLHNASIIGEGSAGFWGVSGGSTLYTVCDDGCQLNGLMADLSGSSAYLPQLLGGSTLSSSAVTGGGTETLVQYFDASSTAGSQPGFTGTLISSILDDASRMSYTATTPANWSGTSPTTIQQALDRIAAHVGPIP